MGKLGFDRMKMSGMVDGSVFFICPMQCNIPYDSSTREVYSRYPNNQDKTYFMVRKGRVCLDSGLHFASIDAFMDSIC